MTVKQILSDVIADAHSAAPKTAGAKVAPPGFAPSESTAPQSAAAWGTAGRGRRRMLLLHPLDERLPRPGQ